jgi:PAS domain S-box-containing protein
MKSNDLEKDSLNGLPLKNAPTNLEKAHIATEAAEEKFALLVDSVKDYGIFLMDIHGTILSWNTGAERIKGYTADDVIGKHFSIFYTDSDIQKRHPQHELEVAAKDGKYEEEGWRIRKNGTKFWANVVITALRDKKGELVGFAKVTRDLSERKLAEEKLIRSEERLRKMFEGIKDYALILLDPNGIITSWNEGARRIKGYEADEIIGKSFKTFYPLQDIQMGKCEYELVEAAQTGRFEDEGWRVRKDGTKFWASVLITAIRDDNGNLIGYSKVTRDITDRKRTDDLLKMAYTNLEKRVEERTSELMKINDKLTEAVRTRDEFLSIASHELRTPLTPLKLQVQNFINNIRKKTIQTMPEDRLQRMGDTCERALTRLTSLIDNLLDVSRINSGKFSLNLEDVNLAELSSDILDRYKLEIKSSGSLVSLTIKDAVIGYFDRIRIEQIFLNLLTNAMRYGNKKPIEIEISKERAHAKIVFQDNGMGISSKDFDRIFERFERVSDNMDSGGLGLGLFITRQIVEAHGGTITVESKEGEGSKFTVLLPLEKTI